MKKIEIEEIKDKLGNTTHIRIITQTHKGNNFTKNGYIFDFNGFRLSSVGGPQSLHIPPILYVRGSYNNLDLNCVPVPSIEWLRQLKEAIDGYNKVNFVCDNDCNRHCNSCGLSKKR